MTICFEEPTGQGKFFFEGRPGYIYAGAIINGQVRGMNMTPLEAGMIACIMEEQGYKKEIIP